MGLFVLLRRDEFWLTTGTQPDYGRNQSQYLCLAIAWPNWSLCSASHQELVYVTCLLRMRQWSNDWRALTQFDPSRAHLRSWEVPEEDLAYPNPL